MAALPLTVNALHKAYIIHNGTCGHTIGRIKYIVLMITIDNF